MFESFDIRSLELTQPHCTEWIQDSGVSQTITELNVCTLDDPCHIDELLNRNTKSRWQHWQHGPGWAVIGIDPETDERTFDGAQFKPDVPVQRFENGQPKFRRDGSPDFQKYFNASAVETTPLFLDTGIPGYWADVLASDHRVLITEGAKKAGAALTAAEACISLPGVSSGQRKGRLKKDLARFCTVGRSLILAFDSDLFHNPNVCKALDRLGRLILERGSLVRVLLLPRETKGIDDFIVANGQKAFKALVNEALLFEEWRKEYLFENRKGQILSIPKPDSTDEPLLVPLADENYILKAQSCLYSNTRWISSKGNLYQWVGTHYEQVDPEAEKRRISAWCASTPVMTIDGWAYRYATDTHVSNIWAWVLTSFAVASSQLNPPGLNCLNGTIKLSWQGIEPSWTLEPHNSSVFYTYVSQFEFDPGADPTSCDRLLECLEPEQEKIFIQTLAASLDLDTIRHFRGRGIRALLCKGDGNNGKDSLREVVQLLYGVGVVNATVSDFYQYDQGRKFTLAKLEGARISWASENSSFSQLDNLQSLKAAITGDPLDIERKNAQDYPIAPTTVFFFNINNAPNLQASLEAIQSRWAVLSFNKTFKTNADFSRGELEADPRFRYDPNFLRKEVVPALLNKMLAALPEVAQKAIDYRCTEAALEEIQRETNHLRAFCQDVGLDYLPGSRVYMGELHKALLEWYIDSGYLTIITNAKGEQKKDWIEPSRRGDKLIKVSKDVFQRFQELFPKAKRGIDYSRERAGQVCLEGIGFAAESLHESPAESLHESLSLTQSAAESAESLASTSQHILRQIARLPLEERQTLIKFVSQLEEASSDSADSAARPEGASDSCSDSAGDSCSDSAVNPSVTTTNSPNAYYNIGSTAEALNSGAGDVIFGNTTKNFPSANNPAFKVGDRVKAKHPTTYGIPEDQELLIKSIQGDVAAVTYEGCRMPFGINVPLPQLMPIIPGFKIGDRVIHTNSTKAAENWRGTIAKVREDGRFDVEWDERPSNKGKRRVYPHPVSDLRHI